jgi:hypothetical protein
MHLELGEENNKLILTDSDFTEKYSQGYISHNEGRSWFITRFLNLMTKVAIGK